MAGKVKVRPPQRKFEDMPTSADPLSELNAWAEGALNKPQEKVKVVPPPAKKVVEAKAKPKLKLKPKVEEAEYEEPADDEIVEEMIEIPVASVIKTVKKGGKKGKLPLTGHEVSRISSGLLSHTIKHAQKEYGDLNILGAGEAGSLVIGVKMPFIMQYILQNNVFPLSRMMQLVGMAKSNKSTLAFEIARWFVESAGVSYLFETESKYSPDMAQSLLGYTDEICKEVLAHVPCKSQQDWQSKLTNIMFLVKQRMDQGFIEKVGGKKIKHPALGRIFPVLWMIDSVSGVIAEEKQEKIAKRGFASRDFAVEAMYNQDYLKDFSPKLVGYPFALVLVNHLKKNKAENGNYIERKKPGGTHIGFQESFELEMSKVKSLVYVDNRPDAPSMEIRTNRIKIKCMKSALGEEEREAQVDFAWRQDRSNTDKKDARQYSKWLWSAATVQLLSELTGERRARVSSVVDVRMIKENLWWSKRLNVPQTKPVSKSKLGDMIEADAEIMAALSELFAIKQRTAFKPGVDYQKVLHTKVKDREKLLNL